MQTHYKLTSAEIKGRTFQKSLRGYNRDQVDLFQTVMAEEWSKLAEENKALRLKLHDFEDKTKKLERNEDSLFKALKSAANVSDDLIRKAGTEAEALFNTRQIEATGLLKEAHNNAAVLIEEAKSSADKIVSEANQKYIALRSECLKLERFRRRIISEMNGLLKETALKLRKMTTPEKEKVVQNIFTSGETVDFAKSELTTEVQVSENESRTDPI